MRKTRLARLPAWLRRPAVATLVAVAPVVLGADGAFRPLEDAHFDRVLIREGVDFSSYDTLQLSPVGVWYPNSAAPSQAATAQAQANLERLQARFVEMMRGELEGRYGFSETPGAGVLRVEVQFIDLRSLAPDDEVPAEFRRYPFRTRGGHISMVGSLLDSETGTELARAADMSPRQSYGDGVTVDWELVDADLERWVTVFAEWLVNAGGGEGGAARE